MSLFGSLMGDVEDDPFFGSHMRHMRQMNNMMNSLFSDPFGMLGMDQGPLAIMGPRHSSAMMPFMPQMPSLNRLFAGSMDGSPMSGSSFSSSTVVMSSGPGSKPQVYSSTSSTKIGPNGIKETMKTVQDSRTGTKKMAIGHHIGERAHVIAREKNLYTGDAEEHQEFINLDEEEAEDFDREFQYKAGAAGLHSRQAIRSGAGHDSASAPSPPPQRLALPAPRPTGITFDQHLASKNSETSSRRTTQGHSSMRPSARRALRTSASPLTTNSSPSVREVYSGSQPQRHRHRHHKNRHAPSNSSNYNNN